MRFLLAHFPGFGKRNLPFSELHVRHTHHKQGKRSDNQPGAAIERARKMAEHPKGTQVDLKESSIYGDDNSTTDSNLSDDFATDTAVDRLELITRGADEPIIPEGQLGQKFDELDACTEEELDALQVNLMQEDERPNARDGSGLILDDSAEEQIARFTESDPTVEDRGEISVEPGRDDTRRILRRHHPNSAVADSDAVVEGNLDEPMDETNVDRKAGEGTAG